MRGHFKYGYVLVSWELTNFHEAFPGDFEHYLYICKVEDKILQHDDEYFVKNECDAVLMKPIDMPQWIEHKIITTAINPDTQKHYDYTYAPLGDITKRIDFPVKFYDSIENNVKVQWDLDETNWNHLKLIVLGSHQHSQHLLTLLQAELTEQSISQQMIVMYSLLSLLFFMCL